MQPHPHEAAGDPAALADEWGRPIATILLVEDEESIGLTLSGILEAEGYQVERAAAVPEALATIERERFDAVLLDLRIGEADGLAVLRRLKETRPDVVGIVLTGYGTLEAAIQAMRAGADDFLLKPSDLAELKASIARALHWRAQLDQRNAEVARVTARLRTELEERTQREGHLAQLAQQLAEAQQLAQLGSWEWDIPRNAVTWSDELYRVYGLEPREFTATYEAFLERVHPDDREVVRDAIRAAYEGREPFDFEHRIVRPDGAMRILHARGKVILDEAGQPVRMLGTGQDITERKQAEERVATLEELDLLKEEIIAIASHDLKSPISSIRGYAQLLRRRVRPWAGPRPGGAGAGRDRQAGGGDGAAAGRPARRRASPGRRVRAADSIVRPRGVSGDRPRPPQSGRA